MSTKPEATSIVLVTAPAAEAEGLADRLLADRLVACVNLIGPVQSRYHWEGKITADSEMILLMKTRTALAERVQSRVSELHGYDCPEVLVFSATAGLPAYLAWVQSEASGISEGG